MSGQRHPDTETLASLRDGLAGGFRGRRIAAHVAGCARCAATVDELAAVSSFLASVPDPALPQTFEQRIAAALAAEAAARTTTERVPADRRPSATPRLRRPALRLRPAMAFVPVLALLLAGFGYLLSGIGGSASSPGSSEAVASSSASSSGSANLAIPAAGPDIAQPAGFLVAMSGTNYVRSTLASQVRAEVAAHHAATSHSRPAQGASSAGSGGVASAPVSAQIPPGFTAPSGVLVGCVLRLTGHTRPALVDKASYQGKPVYVIATSGRVWVVGRGCTAANPALITSAALTGAS